MDDNELKQAIIDILKTSKRKLTMYQVERIINKDEDEELLPIVSWRQVRLAYEDLYNSGLLIKHIRYSLASLTDDLYNQASNPSQAPE